MPHFFCKYNISKRSQKNYNISPGGPPLQDITLWIGQNPVFFRHFEKWGDFQEKVERRGKGDQNVYNQPIDPHLRPQVQNMSCCREIRFSKSKISQNSPNLMARKPFVEMHWNMGHFSKFCILKSEFLCNRTCCAPEVSEEDQWVDCTHFGHLSPGVRPFPENPPIFQNNGKIRDFAQFRG